MKHKIIPNGLVYVFIILATLKLILFFYLRGFVFAGIDYLDVLSPLILALPFAFLWLISLGRWIGFGDAKLAFGIGALLGFICGISAVVLAFWLGALWSIGFIIHNKLKGDNVINLHSEIPFAPFLVLATAIVFFSHLDLLGIGQFLTFLQ